MRPTRPWALALALVVAGAVVLGAVTTGPQLLTGRHRGRGADVVPERRWATDLPGWPSGLAADRAGAVVVAGQGEVLALTPDGATRWRVTVPGAGGLHPPALGAARVLVGAGNRVVALDRATGETRWEAAAVDGAVGPVLLAGGLAFYGTESPPGALVALDATTGRPRWSVRYPGAVRSGPAVADGGILVVAWHGADEARLRAFDSATGTLAWDAPLARFASAPVASGGRIVVAEGDGHRRARVVARRSRDGAELWSTTMPASFESGITPAAADGVVAVVDHFGTLSVLDRRTGGVRHQVALDAPVLHTTVVLTADAIVLTTYGGELAVVDRRTGRVRDRGDPGGYPSAIARAGAELLVAVRLRDPGRVVALRP